jgi:hypothetical protein
MQIHTVYIQFCIYFFFSTHGFDLFYIIFFLIEILNLEEEIR